MSQKSVVSAAGDIASTTAPAGIDGVLELGAEDMARVNGCITAALSSDVVLVNQVANYIVASGGKRLRPLLHVLSAHACGYRGDFHITLAAIIEFIHTATLLHDDVVDESETRRGRKTAHAVWGNAASVLVGDFLYSRSFQLMVSLDSMRVMEILADTTNTIAEGEVQQLLNLGDPEVDETAYLRVIENKTAKLFEAACRLAAVIAGQPRAVEDALASYGLHLGRAFQIADDVLDYDGDAAQMGKDVGDDLAEGKPTLPLIHARAHCDARDQALIDDAVRNASVGDLEPVLAIIRRTGALESAMAVAEAEAGKALKCLSALPETSWRDALETLARHSYQRNH
jgi:octaprenyl-diphosphate synthase